jgi:5-formyltetrahydrofolate cyclo-ligase
MTSIDHTETAPDDTVVTSQKMDQNAEIVPTPQIGDPVPTPQIGVSETSVQSPSADKQATREAYRAARRALTPEVRKKASKAIVNKLTASTAVSKVKTVLIYAATEVEVNLDDAIGALVRAGKRVAVPRMTKTPGVMTLWAVKHVDALVAIEGAKVRTVDITRAVPIEPKDVDLALVPGVAFTATLGRLGQGGGYYDRLLPRLRSDVKKMGIAFDVQIASALPCDEHDVAMDAVVTQLAVYGEESLLAPAPVSSPNPFAGAQSPENAQNVPTPQVLAAQNVEIPAEIGQKPSDSSANDARNTN